MKKRKRLLVGLVLCVVVGAMAFLPVEVVGQEDFFVGCNYMLITPLDQSFPTKPVDLEITTGIN